MKKALIACMMLGIVAQGCKKDDPVIEPPKKEEPVAVIPEKPNEENNAPDPTTPPPTNNNGIIHGVLNKELSYNKFINLDINGDGKNDLYFTSVLVFAGQSHKYLIASSISTSQGRLQLTKGSDFGLNGKWAAPLPKDTKVNLSPVTGAGWENYLTKGILLDILEEATGNKILGPWTAKENMYLGMELKFDGKTHYGWVKVTHKAGEEKVTIAEYAYNTVPLEAINAGQK